MKLLSCVVAYVAVNQLMERDWDYDTAYSLLELKRRLLPHVTFYTEKENELVAEYAVKDEKGNAVFSERGTFTFKDPTKANEYNRRRSELGMVEIQEHLAPIKIKKPESIRPVQLEALQGFIRFGGTDSGAT